MASIAATQPSRHARRVHPRGALSHRCSCPRLPIYRIVQTGGSSSQLSSRALTTACRSSVCFPQLDAVPTAGFSDPFFSYFSAFRYNFGNGALMLKEGYEKVYTTSLILICLHELRLVPF